MHPTYDALTAMGFSPSRADPDIWMRKREGHYEYVAVYVDDLLIASKDPSSIVTALEAHPNLFKLKGTGLLDASIFDIPVFDLRYRYG